MKYILHKTLVLVMFALVWSEVLKVCFGLMNRPSTLQFLSGVAIITIGIYGSFYFIKWLINYPILKAKNNSQNQNN
ncbi:hypothetical protein EBS02_02790 [bacterium]|jgi:hypothetical protein|nr:hypothetical protein [bacterium]